MSVMDSMKSAWHNHPYLIVGAGGVIVLYFLWPSSSSSNTQSAAATTDPYGQQLAAETALSQTQLAEQAATAQNASNNNASAAAALASATATSNEAIAQSNAAAIVSYNQTAQMQVQAEGALAIAQTQTGSTDFASLMSGITAFGANSESGAQSASANGLNAYLTSIGAQFSDTINGNTFSAVNNASGSGWTSSGIDVLEPWFYQNPTAAAAGATGAGGNLAADMNAASSPFAASDNLMASLLSKAEGAYAANQVSFIKTIPTMPTMTQPVLTGNIKAIPTPVA